jgi:hypothetical protein
VPNWSETSAFFKGEGDLVNMGLGKGRALELFNENLVWFERMTGQ